MVTTSPHNDDDMHCITFGIHENLAAPHMLPQAKSILLIISEPHEANKQYDDDRSLVHEMPKAFDARIRRNLGPDWTSRSQEGTDPVWTYVDGSDRTLSVLHSVNVHVYRNRGDFAGLAGRLSPVRHLLARVNTLYEGGTGTIDPFWFTDRFCPRGIRTAVMHVVTVEDLDEEEEVSDIDITAIPDVVLAEGDDDDGRPMWVADCKGLCRRCLPECFKACKCCNMAVTPLGPYRVKLI